MTHRLDQNFRPGELLLLVFELTLGAAGVVMIGGVLNGNGSLIYTPARALSFLLPALLAVGFASWLVFRLRCIGEARHRAAAMIGATCLGIVALSFGAAVGKLATVFLTEEFRDVVRVSIHDPVQQEAAFGSCLAFTGIGLVFAITFVFRAGKTKWRPNVSADLLHEKLSALGQRLVDDWNDHLVTQVDQLMEKNQHGAARELYCRVTGCSHDEAAQTIADWPEQRLRLQVELLSEQLPPGVCSSSAGSHAASAAPELREPSFEI